MTAPQRIIQRGIQSIEVGGKLLLALVHHGAPMALKNLARDAGMSSARAHAYLVSFVRIGMIEQQPLSGLYGLGALALQLGLIGLQQADPVRLAAPLVNRLAQQLGHTVALAVSGSRGATIVWLEESPAAVHVNMRPGTVFSLTGTASGRLFAAYQDPATARKRLGEERRRRRTGAPSRDTGVIAGLPSWQEFERQLAQVREQALSRSIGEVVAGVNAMAAPVFDHTGSLVLAIVAIGPAQLFDTRWDGTLAQAMRQCAAQVSLRLGAPPRRRQA